MVQLKRVYDPVSRDDGTRFLASACGPEVFQKQGCTVDQRHHAPSVAFSDHPADSPVRLDFTVWALRRRARNAIDRWDGTTYRRVVMIGGRVTELAIRQSGSPAASRVIVTATPPLRTLPDRRQVASIVERLLGLQVDLSGWYRVAQRDRRLAELAHRFHGVKPPQFPTVFEALVNAFACQQLSLEVGLELLNRLAVVANVRFGTGAAGHYAFPTPPDVARRRPASFRAIGFSHQKVRALLTLARGMATGAIDLDTLALHSESDSDVRARLLQLQGVGRWTAEYVLLRGLGRLHVFPGDDVGAQKGLARWLGRPAPLDYRGVATTVAPWQPYAGMLYLHLLLDGLSRAGALESAA
jgi:DNA-3-methyladenine glycosylase II